MEQLGCSDDFDSHFDTNANKNDIGVDAVFRRVLAPDGQSYKEEKGKVGCEQAKYAI